VTYLAPTPHFARLVTSGWQFNALITFSGGQPLNFLAGSNVSGSGENKDRVNLVGNPFANIPSTGTLAVYYFNPAAFAKPAAGSFGNLGRDAIYGPGLGTVDYSMFKNFPIFRERIKGQFRVEIFNLFNRTNWAPPTATFTSASFGEMTATRNASSAPGLGFAEPRNIQLALKIIY
jgi:hypothetical protein